MFLGVGSFSVKFFSSFTTSVSCKVVLQLLTSFFSEIFLFFFLLFCFVAFSCTFSLLILLSTILFWISTSLFSVLIPLDGITVSLTFSETMGLEFSEVWSVDWGVLISEICDFCWYSKYWTNLFCVCSHLLKKSCQEVSFFLQSSQIFFGKLSSSFTWKQIWKN